nr:3967_t:CDS:2 [Entrophospora candida]
MSIIPEVKRGIELAWSGLVLAFENRHLHKHTYVKAFFILAAFSLVLYLVTSIVLVIPLKILQLLVYLFSFVFNYDPNVFTERYHLWITKYVFNLPFLGLLFMRYVYPEPLDSLFMESLRNIDVVYLKKHAGEKNLRPPYTEALERYPYAAKYWDEMWQYLKRTGNQIQIATILFLLSLMPIIGSFVYPIASAYALVDSLGYPTAITIGVLMYLTPGTKHIAMVSLETIFSTRALMRELLEPYFGRISFSPSEKKKWFKEREGLLFGFSIAFYPLVRLPLIGMLFYGAAQAATALLLKLKNKYK